MKKKGFNDGVLKKIIGKCLIAFMLFSVFINPALTTNVNAEDENAKLPVAENEVSESEDTQLPAEEDKDKEVKSPAKDKKAGLKAKVKKDKKAKLPTDDRFTLYHKTDGSEVHGEYSIPYILKNYNVFTTGNYKGSHVVGPVIVNGDFNAALGGLTTGNVNGFPHKVASYIGSCDGSFDVNMYSDEIYFYTSPKNNNTYWVIGSDKNVRENATVKAKNFVDNNAMDQFEKQIKNQENHNKETIIKIDQNKLGKATLDNDHYAYEKKGNTEKILISGGQRYDITGLDKKYVLDVFENSENADIIIFSHGKNVQMPIMYFDGNEAGNIESGKETGVIFAAPDAENVTGPSTGQTYHVVAPKAEVEEHAGNYNGCIIAKNIIADGEGHMWPYNGTMLTDDNEPVPSTGFTVKKEVGGNSGDKTKEFSFTATYTDKDGKVQTENFELKHNETKEFKNVQAGSKYTVTEADANKDGYVTTSENAEGTIIKDETIGVKFTNTKHEVGSFTVTKNVEGNSGDKTKEFNFTATYTDEDGKVHNEEPFTLKDGATKNFNAKAGTEYEVKEVDANKDGYVTTSKNVKGKIVKDKTTGVKFTNTKNEEKPEVGSFIVKKTVKGNAGDKKKEFNFTATYTDKDGVLQTSEFKLKDGDTKTFENVKAGSKYTVTEAEADKGGYVTTSENAEGTITKDENINVEFTNTKNEERPELGSFEVKKPVKGNAGDKTKEFSFTATYTDKDGTLQTENFELKDGETKEFKNVKAGSKYTVAEADANKDGYETTSENAEGTITKDEKTAVEFINTKNEEIIPGDEKTTVSVKKIWDDNKNSNRPDSIKVQLYKNGNLYGEPVELNSENEWKYTWTDLNKEDKWTVDEVKVPDGYNKDVENKDNKWTITNTLDKNTSLDTDNSNNNGQNDHSIKTGDNSNLMLWIIVGVIAVCGVVYILYAKKRNNK